MSEERRHVLLQMRFLDSFSSYRYYFLQQMTMTFQKLHCALIAAACAGIVICAAALSHAVDFKMQPFTMQPYTISADLGLDDLSLDGKKASSAKKKPGSKKTSKKGKKRKAASAKKTAANKAAAGAKK